MNAPDDDIATGWIGVEWRHLAALRAVGEEGSFAKAARRLGYTQPAISQQIAALEGRVGGVLIDRTHGSIKLTEAGERLVRHSAAIAARLQLARQDVAAALGGSSVLRLGVFPSVGATLLPSVLRRFTAEWILVRLTLSESWSDKELLRRLELGELDVTFATMPLEPGPFLARVIARDRFVLVAAAGSDLANTSDALALTDLSGVPFLVLHQQRQIESELRAGGIEPNIVFRSDDNQTLLALVAEGLGVAIVPRMALSAFRDPRLVELELDTPLPTRDIALAWSSERELGPAGEAFIACAGEAAARRLSAVTTERSADN